MKTYRVSFRIVPNSHPQMSIVFEYIVDAPWYGAAETQAHLILEDDVMALFKIYDEDWIKRVTARRVK